MRAVIKGKKTFSESERGDELHRFALDIERMAALHEEGAAFFSVAPTKPQPSVAGQEMGGAEAANLACQVVSP